MIRVVLAHRNIGVHTPVREVSLDANVIAESGDEPRVYEDALIEALPLGFLPVDPRLVLLLVDDTAVRRPVRFRAWGKYFPAYSLTVYPEVTP